MADVDDGSITNDDFLLRRIHPRWIVEDKNLNTTRPSSGAFDSPELSVDCERLLVEEGKSWAASLTGHEGHSLVRMLASLPRSRGLPVIQKPLEGNQAHCEVHGKKTPSIAKALSRGCEWVHLEPKAA